MGRDPQILNRTVPKSAGVIHHRHDGHFCVHIRTVNTPASSGITALNIYASNFYVFYNFNISVIPVRAMRYLD